jgi:hypothetical protein
MPEKTDKVWETIRKYRYLLGGVTVAVLLLASWLLTFLLARSDLAPDLKTASLAVVALLINSASTVIVFIVVSVLFAREDAAKSADLLRKAISEAQDRPTDLSKVRWVELIDSAREIDFVVQGWNGWAEHPDIFKALTGFFERGGTFRLYVCNHESDAAGSNRSAMEKRLRRTPAQIVEEIKGTSHSINNCRELAVAEGRNGGKLEVFESNELNWYFAVLFKQKAIFGQLRSADVLVMSIYSHTPGMRPWAMPAIQIHPDQHPHLEQWFQKELEHLRQGQQRQISETAPITSEMMERTR